MNDCPYNSGINCDPTKRHCATCGWSPDGAKRRADKKATKVKNPQQGPTKSKRVAKVDAKGQVVQVYSSIAMASAVNHVSRDVVRSRCEDGAVNPYVDLGGFTFHYIKD